MLFKRDEGGVLGRVGHFQRGTGRVYLLRRVGHSALAQNQNAPTLTPWNRLDGPARRRGGLLCRTGEP